MVDNVIFLLYVFFFFKQKTAYEMRISDWSSDVCSSDLQTSTKINYNANTPAKCCIKHKTFHRYTSRKKQGGVQSVRDNKSGRRSEERRVGKECVSTGRSRWSQ